MGELVEIGRERNVPLDPLLQQTLTRVGGLNRYGEPLYRIVWGHDRTEWVAGKWADGFIGYRELPRYRPADSYHLEFWFPPEHYGSREKWKDDTAVWVNGTCYESLAGYPARGEYEHLWAVQTPEDFHGRRHYLKPTHDMMLHVVQVHRVSIARSRWDIARGQQARRDAERKEYETRRDGILAEAGDKFIRQAIKGRTVRELKGEMEAIMPANHPRPSVTALKHAS